MFLLKPHLLLTLGDFAALTGLAVAQAEQATFIPQHNSTCQHDAKTYQKPQGADTLFQIIATLQKNTTAEDVCYRFKDEATWQSVIMYEHYTNRMKLS
jgi:hypothetical protein